MPSNEVVYQKGLSDDQFEALRQEYYDSDDDFMDYPTRPYEIKAEGNYLSIDNLEWYEDNRSVTLWGNDRMIVLFALAEMLGYDLKKKEG